MMIGSVGTNNYYQMFQVSGTQNTGASASPPDPSKMFDKVDIDGSGGLDQDEFQTLADKISEATGEEVDVEELFATYDKDGDGTLSEEETQAAMEANRPQGPPPGGMQGPPPSLSEDEEDESETSEISLAASVIESYQESVSSLSATLEDGTDASTSGSLYSINTKA